VGYQHVTMFVYLSDVTTETGATRVVSREHTADIPIERTYLHYKEYAHLYALEEAASGPAGSVFVYRPDLFHRGVPLNTPPRRALHTSLGVQTGRPPTGSAITRSRSALRTWPASVHAARHGRANSPRSASQALAMLTGQQRTLAGVAARYPSLDMSPWRNHQSQVPTS